MLNIPVSTNKKILLLNSKYKKYTMFDLIEFLKYIVPSAIIGGITMFFLKSFFKEEKEKRKHLTILETTKQSIPIRFQAYERLTLLLERISMVNLIRRMPGSINSLDLYKVMMIKQINDEFDHNISQQIYVTPELWSMISTTKNATIVAINHAFMKLAEGEGLDEFRTRLINSNSDEENPTNIALLQILKVTHSNFFILISLLL